MNTSYIDLSALFLMRKIGGCFCERDIKPYLTMAYNPVNSSKVFKDYCISCFLMFHLRSLLYECEYVLAPFVHVI